MTRWKRELAAQDAAEKKAAEEAAHVVTAQVMRGRATKVPHRHGRDKAHRLMR